MNWTPSNSLRGNIATHKKFIAQTPQSILCLVFNVIQEPHPILIFLYWQHLPVVNNLIYISKSHATSNQLFSLSFSSFQKHLRNKETDNDKRRKKEITNRVFIFLSANFKWSMAILSRYTGSSFKARNTSILGKRIRTIKSWSENST